MAGLRESLGSLLSRADWQGTATLAALDDELDGVPCLRIEIEVEAEGEFDNDIETERGSMQFRTRVDMELEGELFYSMDEQRPVLLQLEGDATVERSVMRDGGERSFEMKVTQEGDFSHSTLVRVD